MEAERKHKGFPLQAQDLDCNYHLFFCECNNFKEARLEQCPIITLGFDIGPLAQYLARRILEIMLADYPLLNCFVQDEAVIALYKA